MYDHSILKSMHMQCTFFKLTGNDDVNLRILKKKKSKIALVRAQSSRFKLQSADINIGFVKCEIDIS